MTITCRHATAVLFAFILTGACHGQQPHSKADRTGQIRDAIARLIYEVDRLQQDLVYEAGKSKKSPLYERADEVLGRLQMFDSKLRSRLDEQQVREGFTDIDEKLHKLVSAAKDAKNYQIQRDAERIEHADLELHYAIFAGDETPGRELELLKRQVRAFAAAADDLRGVAQLALRPVAAQTVDKLAEAAGKLSKTADAAHTPEDLRQQFRALDQAWDNMAALIRNVPPERNVYLLRTAFRLDALHARIHTLLGSKSERKALTIQT